MSLQQYMLTNFAYAQSNTSYQIEEDIDDPTYNCFAYAVGVTSRLILPYTWAKLDEAYK